MVTLYPDDLSITGEHVRQSGWKMLMGEPDDVHGPDWSKALEGAETAAEEGKLEHAKILSLLAGSDP